MYSMSKMIQEENEERQWKEALEDRCNFKIDREKAKRMNEIESKLRKPTDFYQDLTNLMNWDMEKLTIDNFIELYIFDKSNLTAYYNRVSKDYYNLEDAKEYLKCLFMEKKVFMKNVIVGARNRNTMFISLMANSRSDAQKNLFKSFYERRNHSELARNYAYNQIYKMPKKTIERIAEELNKIIVVDVIKVENAPDLVVTSVPSKPNEHQKKRYTFKVLNGDTSQNGFNSLSEMTYMIKD